MARNYLDILRGEGRSGLSRALVGGAAGLVALYLLSLLPIGQQAIDWLERACFSLLNRMLGRNAALDWTILITASTFWIYTSLLVLFVLLIAEAWNSRQRHYGGLFGFIGLGAVAALLVEELADFIADYIQRDLPWDDGALDRIRDFYDADFLDIPSKEGILDENACYWIFALILMNGRLPISRRVGTVLIAVHIVSQLSIGAQWLGDMAVSLFVAMLLAGLVTQYGRQVFARAERKASELFLDVFWSSFIHLPSELVLRRPPRMESRLRRAVARVQNRREVAWERIMRRQVLPLLRADPERATWSTHPPEQFQAGFRPSPRVRFVYLPSGEIFVVRSIQRWGGVILPSKKFRRHRDAAQCNLYLGRLGLPVPRAYWLQENFSHRGLASSYFMIEEFVAARPLDLDSPSEVNAACNLLARMHEHADAHWGPVASGRQGSGAEYLYQSLRREYVYQMKRIAAWQRLRFDPQDFEAVWGLFENEAIRAMMLKAPAPFRLIHGDVHFRNFLIGERGDVHLIDFVTVRYDLAGWEIMKMALSFSRRRGTRAREVWTAYFHQAGETAWKDFREESTLALGRLALYELSNRRALRAKAAKSGLTSEEVVEWIRQIFEQAEELIGERPEDTNWKEIISMLGARRSHPEKQVI